MEKIKLLNNEYNLINNEQECFNLEELEEKITDYFTDYDYIFGDYAYDKLRLKGFCDKSNELYNEINDINGIEDYKKNYCSYGAKTFLLKKIK